MTDAQKKVRYQKRYYQVHKRKILARSRLASKNITLEQKVRKSKYAKRYYQQPKNKLRAAIRQKRYKKTSKGHRVYRESFRRWVAKQRLKVQAIKNRPCKDCKHRFPPECMDFHHIKGRKKFTISSKMMGSKALQREVAKCIIICANCHRVRTKKERRGW